MFVVTAVKCASRQVATHLGRLTDSLVQPLSVSNSHQPLPPWVNYCRDHRCRTTPVTPHPVVFAALTSRFGDKPHIMKSTSQVSLPDTPACHFVCQIYHTTVIRVFRAELRIGTIVGPRRSSRPTLTKRSSSRKKIAAHFRTCHSNRLAV